MWTEMVMAYFKILSQHLPEGTVENHINLSQDGQPVGQVSNPHLLKKKQESQPLNCNIQPIKTCTDVFILLILKTSSCEWDQIQNF
jgi:hypothetical protein